MKLIRRTFTLVVAAVLFVSLTSVASAQDPDKGKEIWEGQVWQCMQCHGPNGEGVFGAPLAGTTKTAEEFITQVRTPRSRMPHFSTDQVSDEQIRDIQAYMASLPVPTQNAFKQIDLPADAPAGQQLMVEKRCVACHGDVVETGQGEPLESLVARGVTPTADVVIKQLRTPFKNMPSFSDQQVTDAEAGQIADYLTSLVAEAPPATLPQAGDASSAAWPIALWLVGSGLLLTGLTLFYFRRVALRS